MTQIIYDDKTFFAGYSSLPGSVHGLDGAPEWPVLRAMLPSDTLPWSVRGRNSCCSLPGAPDAVARKALG